MIKNITMNLILFLLSENPNSNPHGCDMLPRKIQYDLNYDLSSNFIFYSLLFHPKWSHLMSRQNGLSFYGHFSCLLRDSFEVSVLLFVCWFKCPVLICLSIRNRKFASNSCLYFQHLCNLMV